MSKSLIFRIAVIALVWILMVKAGFGIFLTLLAVFFTFLTVNAILGVFRVGSRVADKVVRR